MASLDIVIIASRSNTRDDEGSNLLDPWEGSDRRLLRHLVDFSYVLDIVNRRFATPSASEVDGDTEREIVAERMPRTYESHFKKSSSPRRPTVNLSAMMPWSRSSMLRDPIVASIWLTRQDGFCLG
nr:hypothetical protein CFP56_07819 [Quercus suber]